MRSTMVGTAIITLVFGITLRSVSGFDVDAGETIEAKFPLDSFQLNGQIDVGLEEYNEVLHKSTGVVTATITSAQCPILSNSRYPSSIQYQFYLPELKTKRIPLVIATKKIAAIEKFAIAEADRLNTGVLSVTGFKNSMGYQGGFYTRFGKLYPYMSTWGIEAVVCIIEELERTQPVAFSGWYIWGHSGAAQFAHKFAFYQKTSASGIDIPKKVKAYFSSAPGHPYLAGYNDIETRHRVRHQFHFHQIGTKDNRLDAVTAFAEAQNLLPSFYGRVTLEKRIGGTHSPAPTRLNIPNIYKKFGQVMELTGDNHPCFRSWEYVPSKSVVDTPGAPHPTIEGGDTLSPHVRVYSTGSFVFRLTATDGIDHTKDRSSEVNVVVKQGDHPAQPVLSVILHKADASQDDSSPGIFEIRSSRPMGAKETLQLNYKITGARFTEFTEPLFGTRVIDFAGGDWSNIRYVFEKEKFVEPVLQSGTQSFFVMVHGSSPLRTGAATLTLSAGEGYKVDPSFTKARIRIRRKALGEVKVVEGFGGTLPVSIDSPSFDLQGRSFQITKKPKHGEIKVVSESNYLGQYFPMVTYKPSHLASCVDSFKYKVKSGRRSVATGEVRIVPKTGSQMRCVGALMKPCRSTWSQRFCERKRTRLDGFWVHYCEYDSDARKCVNVAP